MTSHPQVSSGTMNPIAENTAVRITGLVTEVCRDLAISTAIPTRLERSASETRYFVYLDPRAVGTSEVFASFVETLQRFSSHATHAFWPRVEIYTSLGNWAELTAYGCSRRTEPLVLRHVFSRGDGAIREEIDQWVRKLLITPEERMGALLPFGMGRLLSSGGPGV